MCSDPDSVEANKVRPVVLDTNIVLDVFVFKDPATQPLKQALDSNRIQWLATQAMRDELERVLSYPKILARRAVTEPDTEKVLQQFDAQAHLVGVAPKAGVSCSDPDDQKFIDLALAHKALLLSKDRAVLGMARRLLVRDVLVRALLPAW